MGKLVYPILFNVILRFYVNRICSPSKTLWVKDIILHYTCTYKYLKKNQNGEIINFCLRIFFKSKAYSRKFDLY